MTLSLAERPQPRACGVDRKPQGVGLLPQNAYRRERTREPQRSLYVSGGWNERVERSSGQSGIIRVCSQPQRAVRGVWTGERDTGSDEIRECLSGSTRIPFPLEQEPSRPAHLRKSDSRRLQSDSPTQLEVRPRMIRERFGDSCRTMSRFDNLCEPSEGMPPERFKDTGERHRRRNQSGPYH